MNMEMTGLRETSTGKHDCLILGQGSRMRKLLHLLELKYNEVRVAGSCGEIDNLPPGYSADLLLIADGPHNELNKDQLKGIKERINPRATVCLADYFTRKQEIELRSAGLVFLGNYKTFFAFSEGILNQKPYRFHKVKLPAQKVNNQEVNKCSRSELARQVEVRLSGRKHRLGSLVRKGTFRSVSFSCDILNRLLELVVGLLVCLFFVPPLIFFLFLRKLTWGIPVFSAQKIIGAGGHFVTIRRFNRTVSFLQNIPLYFELLTGKLALVGPAITDWELRSAVPAEGYIRTLKPGIVSLWQVRQASRISHEGQEAIDWEYIFKKRPVYDFLLLLRFIPAMLYRESSQNHPEILNLFGLDIANIDMQTAMNQLDQTITNAEHKSVYFVNPDCLNKMSTDKDYFQVLKNGSLIFPDGIGLTVAGKLLNTPLKENINGTDMFPYICRLAAERGYSLFLLGGKPGIAAETARVIEGKYKVKIAGTAHGYFDHDSESNAMVESVNQSGADILLVAFGAPRQEKWIATHCEQLKPNILMGVGGLFDFYSGNIKRAPVWMREIGLEWIYRILQEPGRMWRRYVIGNPLFISRVIRWKFVSR